jgi:LCP family protein required for cell wall assembly
MNDDTTIKLERPQHIPQIPPASNGIQEQPEKRSEQSAAIVDDEQTINLEPDSLPPLEYEQTWDSSTSSSPDVKMYPALTPLSASLPPTAPPASTKKTRGGRRRWPKWVKVVVTIFLILLVLAGGTAGYGYYYFATNIQKPLQKIIHPVSLGKDEQHLKVQPLPPDTAVTGRSWNILLLGSDNDQKYSFPDVLTQVMMVVHIDTVTNSVTLVSIPRDSWVNVPEIGGMHKIDQAFFLGASQHNNFDDGVRIARETIENDYGITIDRYAWVGLSGFANVINTLGGVDVDVTHPIVDDNYPADTGKNANDPYALQRLNLAPGPQHLNGEQALEYVRSRHADLVGDIGRTVRQQQVLEALKLKLNATSVLTNLHQLITDLTGNVYTDLTEQEMIGFAVYGHDLSNSAIHSLTLGPGPGSKDYGDFGTVYDPSVGAQQDIVIPHCQNIQPIINQIFGLGNAQSCNVSG